MSCFISGLTAARIAVTIGVAGSSMVVAQQDNHRASGPVPDVARQTVSLTTLNMAKEKNPERILKEWRAHPDILNSDIILLQEVAHNGADRPSAAAILGREMGYYVVSTSAAGVSSRDTDGLAIMSRYPLTEFEQMQLDHNEMLFHTRNRFAIAATVQTPLGPLRVYDLHLDSRINAHPRLKQIAPVIAKAAQWDGPRLIGGDFNTNYFRWIGNVVPIGLSSQSHAIQQAMSEKGFTSALAGSGPTSDFLRMHLDWFYTRDVQVFDRAIQPMKFSDHHAVRIKVAPNPTLPHGGSRRDVAFSTVDR